jgi:hypothetical protein
MDFEALLRHYFGTDAIETLDPEALELGIERLGTDMAVEQEPGRRFALWALLHALGAAPDPENAFEDEAEQRAARDYAWAADKAASRLQ